jgi:hypothetical protein
LVVDPPKARGIARLATRFRPRAEVAAATKVSCAITQADAERVRYLDRDECRRLVNVSPEPLRTIVRGALLTGARCSELAHMNVPNTHGRHCGRFMALTSLSDPSNRILHS